MAENELRTALDLLEREKHIPKEAILDAIKEALLQACKQTYGSADNFSVALNPETCDYHIYETKTVVDEVTDPQTEITLQEAHEYDGSYKLGDLITLEIKTTHRVEQKTVVNEVSNSQKQISLDEAREYNSSYQLGDVVEIESNSVNFGRIAAKAAKDAIVQKLKEVEKQSIFEEYKAKEHTIVTGIVERFVGKNISVNLGRTDALLMESEQIKGEHYEPTDRIKVLILEVSEDKRGPRIRLSRTHPDFIRCLFTEEVAEIRDGIVEIKAISREAGNRTKMAVWSNDPDVDPVGACVGMNGSRVNAVVSEIGKEKIDIIEWSDNAANFIENALAPAKVIAVVADSDEKKAKVVVPDYQLSLAIGREGQNARLAARLTGFRIDIKSETQARELGDEFIDMSGYYGDEDDFYDEDYEDEESDGDYDEESDGDYEDDYETEEPAEDESEETGDETDADDAEKSSESYDTPENGNESDESSDDE